MDEESIDKLVENLGERADREGRNALDANQLLVLIAWWSKGVIDNGGFRKLVQGTFIDGRLSLKAVARAFQLLGFERIYTACAAVERELFKRVDPDSLSPAAYAEVVDKVDFDRLLEHDRVVFDISYDDLTAAIGEFVSKNPSSFGVWVN